MSDYSPSIVQSLFSSPGVSSFRIRKTYDISGREHISSPKDIKYFKIGMPGPHKVNVTLFYIKNATILITYLSNNTELVINEPVIVEFACDAKCNCHLLDDSMVQIKSIKISKNE